MTGGRVPVVCVSGCIKFPFSFKMQIVFVAVCVLALAENTASFSSPPLHSKRLYFFARGGGSTRASSATEYLRSSRWRQYQCGVSKLAITSKVQNDYNGETSGYPLQPTYPSAPEGVRTCWVRYFYEGNKLLDVSGSSCSTFDNEAPRRQTYSRRPMFSNPRA
jgi:hypothetical protein